MTGSVWLPLMQLRAQQGPALKFGNIEIGDLNRNSVIRVKVWEAKSCRGRARAELLWGGNFLGLLRS